MKVVQVVTGASATEWARLAAHIAAQPPKVKIDTRKRTITTTLEGPVIDTPTGPTFQWQLVQS